MLVEHARTLLGVEDAAHAESGAGGTFIVTPLACSLDGLTIDVALVAGTRLAALHCGATTVSERTTCNYDLDGAWQHIASTGGLVASAVDGAGRVRAVERQDHPFFLATLYQPQLRSAPGSAHPVWLGFLQACSGLD